MANEQEIVLVEQIEPRILAIRGQKVMLDADLAELYGVTTKRLNEQVRRNPKRFPEDFAFQLTPEEWKELPRRSRAGRHPGGRRYAPYAFTEHGVVMLSTVLTSPRANAISLAVVRTFLRQRGEPAPPPPWREPTPLERLFAAIRETLLRLPGDERYTTPEPCTYFVQAGRDGPIKIGSTTNLAVRLRTLWTLSPVPLKLLGIMYGAQAEKRCHMQLGAYRLHGEWFAPSAVVLDFIRKNAVTPESCKSAPSQPSPEGREV